MVRSRNLVKLVLIIALATLTAGPVLTGCSLFKKEPPPATKTTRPPKKEPEKTAANTTAAATATPSSPSQTSSPALAPPAKPADLLVTDIDWSPRDPRAGETLTFTVVISNQGGSAAGASRVNYYINDVPAGNSPVAAIPAGGKLAKKFVWRVENLDFWVKVSADSSGAVAESDETNNSLEVAASGTQYADLAVDDVKWSPQTPSTGDNMTFTVSLANHGQGESAPAVLDYYADDVLFGEQSLSPLAPGDTLQATFNWVAVTGSHTIKVVINSADPIIELGEDNNTREVKFTGISFTDLVVDAVTWSPLNTVPGQVITVTAKIKNLGPRTAEPSLVAYYLDDHAPESIPIGAVAANVTATVTFTTTAASGIHRVSVMADSYHTVAESNEANNLKSVVLSNVTFADLVVDNVTWYPRDPSQGETINISAIIKNISTQSANTTLEYFYVDDKQIGAGRAGVLAANASANITVTWKAETGAHTLRVVADATELIPEVSEINNRKEVEFPGARPVDLTIEEISWSPLNPFVNENMTITVTVKNQGTGQSAAAKVSLEIDGSAAGNGSVPAIAPGASSDASFTWRAAPGSHNFKAAVDPARLVAEKDKTNNELTVTFSGAVVPQPDLALGDVTWSPQPPFAGQAVTFNVTIQNLGAAPAPPEYLSFEVDGAVVKLIRIFTIAAGNRWVETFTWVATPGTHQLKLTADAGQSIIEISKANNSAVLSITVSP